MPKDHREVVELLKEIIEDVSLSAISRSDVREADGILDDLGLDSLDFATVMLTAELRLGSRVQESSIDWRKIRTVGDLADLLTRAQG